uniref:Smr domain-containing protein n=1 Tax=Anopheles culicifacies TaxID=139723 RepID=A0A182MCP8_9DIPT
MFGDHIDQQRIIDTIEKYDDVNACVEALLKDEEQCVSFPELKTTADKLPLPTVPTVENDCINGPDRSTGATRKLVNVAKNDASEMTASFASLLQKGSFPTQFQQPAPSNNSLKPRGTGKHKPAEQPANFQNILDMVAQGYRVMVLMRGAPGSGKSYLARTLIDHTSEGDYRNHIFSADDYFMVNEVYKFQPDAIDAAHRFNQQNVLAKARDGWSPIVVDNTNIRLWEMFEYVKIAAAHGYFLEVLEPMTYWRNSSRSLAIRNTHGVPEPKIKNMLQNFEKLTNVQELYRLCNLEHALYMQVKMRHYPILSSDLGITDDSKPIVLAEGSTNAVPQGTKWCEPWGDIPKATKDNSKQKTNDRLTDLSAIPPPKPPRDLQKISTPVKEAPRHQKTIQEEPVLGSLGLNDDDLPDDWCKTDTNWKPYDTESNQFWGQAASAIEEKQKKQIQTADVLALESQPQRTTNPHHEPITQFLLSSVKEPTKLPMKFPELSLKSLPSQPSAQPTKDKPSKKTDMKRIALTKHKRGCPNENTSFSEICNLYPKVPESYLWDLFEKCGGDGDWVANILLEEQKLDNFESSLEASQQQQQGELVDALTDTTFRWNLLDCNCNEQIAKSISSPSVPTSLYKEGHETGDQVPANNMTTGTTGYQSPRETIRRGQGQRKTTQSIKREIEARFVLGNKHFSEPIQKLRLARRIVPASDESPPGEMLDMETNDKATDSEVVELQLGVELVQQLHAIFKDKHCPKSLELDNIQSDRTRVFMATEMAEQLYLLFLDSLYSYTEEEKLLSLREDARMAQLMQTEEKYPALFKPPNPSGTPNLKDIIEMEEALVAYQKETNASWQKEGLPDLAQQMSQQKLKEMFPHVNGDDLVQILAAHHNRFEETVQVLNASIPDTVRQEMLEREELLKQRAENEKQKLLDLFSSPTYATPSPTGSTSQSGEEAINFHLMKAEECRNLAQHHLDLKNECHEKARQAIQRNLPGLVDYYSQIARLHRTKIDMYNSRASNCIMEVHKLKLNNDAVLDLHYLHSQEALGCLELFLAEHASNLLNSQQRFKTLYIITGRGLHSADGKPIIKQRVKALLRAKNIRYTELNPGFLKIKLYNRNDLEQLMVAD